MFLQTLTLFTFFSLCLACSNDNCLNALNHAGASAKSFCATYTHGVSTATTALPTYATQCKNLPSRISSACSCLATSSSTTSTKPITTLVTVTSSVPGATCSPSVSQPVEVIVNEAPGTTVQPNYGFISGNTNFFEVDFSNYASDPYLTTVTLFAPDVQICDGTGIISYQYAATINAIAANPVPENNNCTITSGLTGIQDSVKTNTVNWVTEVPVPSYSYSFPLIGLGKAGKTVEFYITIGCTLVDWWPEIQIRTPSFVTA